MHEICTFNEKKKDKTLLRLMAVAIYVCISFGTKKAHRTEWIPEDETRNSTKH